MEVRLLKVKKRKENKSLHLSCLIKDIAVGLLYAFPILVLVLSAFRSGLAEQDLYLTFITEFNFNPIFDCLVAILSKFDMVIGNSNLYIALSLFSWFVFVGLMDCVYDVFDFLISMFQSFIHKGY